MDMVETNISRIKKVAWVLATANLGGEYKWNHINDNSFDSIYLRTTNIFSSGNAIVDPVFETWKRTINVTKYLDDCFIVNKFYDRIIPYLNSSEYFKIKDTSVFTNMDYSAGSQETFLNYMMLNKSKRLRLFKGDYWWHLDICDSLGIDWAYIEDDDLLDTDFVIFSCPFALTGSPHINMIDILEVCEHRGIEVLVDLIYMPNYKSAYEIDLGYECINTITFSFSKTFPMQTAKIAVRLQKKATRDPLSISNNENIENRLALGLGVNIMDNYPINYMVNTYKDLQDKWCNLLGLVPSNVIHFAHGSDYVNRSNQYSKYNIQTSRYNLGMLYQNDDWLSANFLKKLFLNNFNEALLKRAADAYTKGRGL